MIALLVRKLLIVEAEPMSATAVKTRRARRRRPPIGRILFIGIYLAFVLAPLYWMFVTSIKPSDDYLANPPVWFPTNPTILHYTAALFAYRGWDGLINSLIVSTAATLLSTLFGTLMAYSLARYQTGGKHLSFWVLSQRFLPPIATVLPIFLIYRNIGLHDTEVRPYHRVHRVHAPGDGLDDAGLFPPASALAGGGGAGRRLHAVARLLERRRSSRRAWNRGGDGLRLHRLLDRVLFRADPHQPELLHAADRLPCVLGFPGRAVR